MTTAVPRPDEGDLPGTLRFQADTCRQHGSVLYADLLARVADDVESAGPCLAVLAGHENDPFGSVLPLRFLGAVHRIVLSGRAPELAASYPSAGGDARRDPWPAFLDVVERHRSEVREGLEVGVQTNEVGRSAALVLGFLATAHQTGMPLRILELGASAGLNLRWDRFRYEGPTTAWGDPNAALRFSDCYDRDPGFDDKPVEIVERRGCDPNPIDPTSNDGRLALRAFVWPDQTDRMHRLDAACSVAAEVPAVVDRADGPTWLLDQLLRRNEGVATVVFHSIVVQYVGRAGRQRLDRLFGEAGATATRTAPLFRLSFEPGPVRDRADVRLQSWPGGNSRLLARSAFHGRPIELV